MPKIHKIDVQVKQRPYAVGIECPICEYESEIEYGAFCDLYGDPPDWTFEKITCSRCGAVLQIDGQEWD